MNQENRRNPRFPFIAVAEIVHTESGGKFSCRVSELSLNGCYVDMLNTLPVGSEVVIKIVAESESFEAKYQSHICPSKSGDRTCVRGSIVKERRAFTSVASQSWRTA
jgi:PilZ domain